MNIQKIPVNRLNPAAYNPRKDLQPGDPEYDKLKRSIDEFGLVEPIVWNQHTGNVISGHQRLKVLIENGVTETDCAVVDLDEMKEKALNVALNNISGGWDMDRLGQVMSELAESSLAELTGFSQAQIDKMVKESETAVTEMGEINLGSFDDDTFEHECPRCGFRYKNY